MAHRYTSVAQPAASPAAAQDTAHLTRIRFALFFAGVLPEMLFEMNLEGIDSCSAKQELNVIQKPTAATASQTAA